MRRGAVALASLAGAVLAALAALAWSGCAHAPATPLPAPGGEPDSVHATAPWAAFTTAEPPAVDSATVALWHMEESGSVSLEDSGPLRLTAYLGRDTRPEFGRYRSARRFTRSTESFAYVPYAPELDAGTGWSIEAWVNPDEYSWFEASVIAARWTRNANQQSWLLALAGQRRVALLDIPPSPRTLFTLVRSARAGTVVVALQPDAAGEPRAYSSTSIVETGRWTHVAATYDGEVVRIYLDGRLDAEYASTGGIRASDAPLALGNLLDPNWITLFQGSARLEPALNAYPHYAFAGLMDEVRLSRAARAPAGGRPRRR